jgi:hypothetical protein
MLTEYAGGIKENGRTLQTHDVQIQQLRSAVQSAEAINNTQNSQIAVSDTRNTYVVDRLDSIEKKVDRVIERQQERDRDR